MEAPWPRIIRVDSRFRTNGASSTDFQVLLPYPVQLPAHAKCFVTAFTCPVSWYNVEQGLSDKLYVIETRTPGAEKKCRVITLPPGNYTSQTVTGALEDALNAGRLFVGSMVYQVTWIPGQGVLRIQLATQSGGTTDATARFQMPGMDEIASTAWKAANWTAAGAGGGADAYATNDPDSVADFLRLPAVSAPTTILYTGLLNIAPVDVLYLHSNLGTFDSLGPRGETSIIQRLPVTSSYGYQLHYTASGSDEEYFSVGNTTLQSISFRLTNVWGKVIDLHGGAVSLELTFRVPE